ncbi:hypothetical protein LKD70_09070 [Ruminococcus sp. CLA-AA-H200]|uniref:Uncharacterized protein n=1 Tax=Ruminococcus turbiniformis TaxID=2881258 RepID=A0ABS8FX00_9FIRM|nr:hypothetical protein [Ruminococcus turbiniformis]MCC2254565.1 hypothetical protein [Ruminococcus turbiniformis]
MVATGKNLDDFLQSVEKIQTKQAQIAQNHTVVDARIEYEPDGLVGWSIRTENETGAVKQKRGRKYDTFIQELQNLDKKEKLFQPGTDDAVLCYRDTTLQKNGGSVSNWFALEPGFPFWIGDDGQPKFNIIQLTLKDWEYARMMETQLAFRKDGILYPVTRAGAQNVGSFLDCSSAFKSLDDCQLGSAILLSEKIAKTANMQVLYRESSPKVRPVLAACGRTYVHIPLKEFFQEAIGYIPALWALDSWEIMDFEATIRFRSVAEPRYLICINAGDLPGKAVSVSSAVDIEGCQIPIRVNKLNHRGSIGSIQDLFIGIEVSVDAWQHMDLSSAGYSPKVTSGIMRVLGKKRASKVNLDGLGSLTGWKLIHEIIRRTYQKLPQKQKTDLAFEYQKMILRFAADKMSDQ